MPHLKRLPRLNLISVAAVCGLLYAFRSVLAPFVLAFVLALLVDSLLRSKFLATLGGGPMRMIAASLLGIGLVLGAATIVFGGLKSIGAQIPLLLQRLEQLYASGLNDGARGPSLDLHLLVGSLDPGFLVSKGLSALQEAMSGAFLTLIFFVLILASKALIRNKVLRITSPGPSGQLAVVIERSVEAVQVYVWIQTITGLMVAAGGGVLMAFVGLDNSPFWALALFLLSFVPVLGVAIGALAPALFALVQFPTLWPALVIFLGIQAIALVVGALITPKIQADTQNIDPAVGLLVTGIWTVLWGVPGAFLAIPLTLALMFLLAQYDGLRWLAVLVSNNGDPLPGCMPNPRSKSGRRSGWIGALRPGGRHPLGGLSVGCPRQNRLR